MSDLLAGAGLILGFVGAVIVWRWGLPPAEVGALLLESAPSADEVDRTRRAQRRTSNVGVLLIAAGFALQFAGLLLND